MRRTVSLLGWLLVACVAGLACGRRTGLSGAAGGGGTNATDGGAGIGAAGTGAAAGANGVDAARDDAALPVSEVCPARAYPQDGGCLCQATLPDVCPNPCFGGAQQGLVCSPSERERICVDLLTDPDQCGACGIKCPEASVCTKGVCGPTPTLAVPPMGRCTGISLAVQGGNLYWTDAANGTINRMPTTGGAVVSRQGQPDAKRLQVFGDSIYWILPSANALLKAPLVGGAPTLVVAIPDADDAMPFPPKGLQGFTVADDGTAYVSIGSRIYEVTSAGGPPRVVVEQARGDAPGALALDGKTITFPLLSEGKVEAVALPAPGEPAAKCGDYTPDQTAIACWIAFTHEPLRDTIYARNGQVFVADRLDGSVETFTITRSSNRDRIGDLPSGAVPVDAFTIQGDSVFYVANGYVVRAPLVKGSVGMALVRNQPLEPAIDDGSSRTSIAADDTQVFWTTTESVTNGKTCTIQRLKYR